MILMEGAVFCITAYGLRIGDGGAFEIRKPKICTNAQ